MAEALGLAGNCLTIIDLTTKLASTLYAYGKDVADARADIESIHDKVLSLEKVNRSVHTFLIHDGDRHHIPSFDHLRDGVLKAEEKLEQLDTALEIRRRRKLMRKFGFRSLRWPFQSRDVEKIVSGLQDCLQLLSQSLQLDQTSLLLEIDRSALLDRLPQAQDAAYDSRVEEQNPTCHPETRSGILLDIHQWATDPRGKNIFWLNGMAGTGKSTISRTVAQSLAQEGALAASFFFKKGESNRGGCARFFSTIAFQLASREPGFGQALKEILQNDPSLIHKSLRDQFNQLLIEPLSSIPTRLRTSTSFVLVVDALDECDNDNDIRTLIHLLSGALWFPHPWRLKAFITSRPELPIRLGFGAIDGTFQDLILHNVSSNIIGHDIAVFLRDELNKIRLDYNISVPQHRQLQSTWPGQASVQHITEMAAPLFIAAATLCRFVSDRRNGNPREQLGKIINYPNRVQASKLEAVYLPVLHQTLSGLSGADYDMALADFHTIVGTIILLFTPLSPRVLGKILRISMEKLESRLDLLHSCLHVTSDPTIPVRLLHLSFHDFLVDPKGRGQHIFWIDEKASHLHIAECCLDIMESLLRRNICNASQNPGHVGKDDFDIVRYIPKELEYSCLYWIPHLVEAEKRVIDGHQVHLFLEAHLLHWIEVICIVAPQYDLLGDLRNLAALIHVDNAPSLGSLLDDALRMVSTNLHMIRQYPLQIYSSMLMFAPSNSIVRNTFAFEVPASIGINTGLESDWDPCLMRFDHSWGLGTMKSLSWSPDDRYLAAISLTGNIQVWDVISGQKQYSIEAHGRTKVSFSHDSDFLAASGKNEIGLYRTATRELVQTITSYGYWAFAKDAPLLATILRDGDIALWEISLEVDGSYFTQKQVITASNITISWINISREELVVATTYRNYQVELWRACRTGNMELNFQGTICSQESFFRSRHAEVVLSFDSQLVAFVTPGSILANKVDIFCARNGELVQSFDSDYSIKDKIVFSPDSQLLARDSGKGTIEIKSSINDLSVMNIGHQGATSVAFSHDSKKLAVALATSIQVWPISRSGSTKVKISDKSREPISWVELSPDASVLAVGLTKGDIQLWDPMRGKRTVTISDHSSTVRFRVFSTDSRFLASCCERKLGFWNVTNGKGWSIEHTTRWYTTLIKEYETFLSMKIRRKSTYRKLGSRRFSLIHGFPTGPAEDIIFDKPIFDDENEIRPRQFATFRPYTLVMGNLDYSSSTGDIVYSRSTQQSLLRTRVRRYVDGKWVTRGLPCVTQGH